MTRIRLTDFVDFIVSSGPPKAAKVRQIADRPPYDPRRDFYRAIREGIINYHQSGNKDKKFFNGLLDGLNDEKKKTNYPPLISGYKTFLGKKDVAYLGEKKADWTYGDLTISVNPELYLAINDVPHVIKLYFKGEAVSKPRIALIQYLMQLALSSKVAAGTKYCILDIRSKRLYDSFKETEDMLALLQGEAMSFAHIHNARKRKNNS